MKHEWIRGRFRGVYSAPQGRATDGVRRVPFDLQYGELSDVAPISAPESTGDELHFDRVARVRIAPSEGGPAEGERTLFDVRIRDCQLLYPAESAKRLYGTLVGELSARLLPEPVESPLELLRPANPAPAPPRSEPAGAAGLRAQTSEAAPLAPLPLELPEPTGELREDTTHDQDMERLLWLLVPSLLCTIGAVLAAGCGPETAAIWLAPLAAAIAIRQTPARFRVHGALARRWFGGLCLLAPIFVLLGALQTGWVADCRAPIRASLVLIGAPVAAAAFTRTQIWVWLCAVIWTATLVGWCGNLDGTCAASGAGALLR